MLSRNKKALNPFIVLKYHSCFFLLNGAFVDSAGVELNAFPLPDLRYPFSDVVIRNNRLFPVICLENVFHIKEFSGHKPFFIFLRSGKCSLCINTGRLPYVFYEFNSLTREGDFKFFNVYRRADDPGIFIELMPDGLYHIVRPDALKIMEIVNGGTGI